MPAQTQDIRFEEERDGSAAASRFPLFLQRCSRLLSTWHIPPEVATLLRTL